MNNNELTQGIGNSSFSAAPSPLYLLINASRLLTGWWVWGICFFCCV